MSKRTANTFLLFLLALLLAGLIPTTARAAASTSERVNFVVSDCAKDNIPLRFQSEAALPVAVRTKAINSKDAQDAPPAWTIVWDKPSVSDPAIMEYQTSGTLKSGCPHLGSFDVQLTVFYGDKNTPSSELPIKVVRSTDPVLDTPSAATLVVKTGPGGIGGALGNNRIQLRETSYSSTLKEVSASGTALKAASGESTAIEINSGTSSIDVAPGAFKYLPLALSGMPAPGVYTSRLNLHSPSLQQNQNIDLTVQVRVFEIYLLFTILCGIVLGYIVNEQMTQRSALDTAILDGMRAAAAIAQGASVQKDPAVQQRLLALAGTTEANIRQSSDPVQVQKAIEDGQAAAKIIETEAAAQGQAFVENLERLRGIVEPNHLALDAALADRLAPLLDALKRVDRTGATGDIEEATRQLQAVEHTLQRSVLGALQPWLSELHGDLEQFGPWASPAQNLEQTRSAMLIDIFAAYSVSDPAQLVQKSDDIARRLRTWIALSVPQGMADAFRAAALVLEHGGLSDLSQTLSSLADDLMRPGAADLDPLVILKSFIATRHRVETVLRGAGAGAANIDARLTEGDFPGAAVLLVPAQPAPPPAALVLAMLQPLQRTGAALAAPATPDPRLRLIVPPLIVKNETVNVTAHREGLPTNSGLTWECTPDQNVTITGCGVNEATLTAREEGFLTISVKISNPPAEASAKAYVGQVTATKIYEELSKQAKLLRWGIAFVAAVLTAFAGYQILSGSWYGTLGDFFTAFIWGFFGQFGLDRIRDLSKPIIARPLPTATTGKA